MRDTVQLPAGVKAQTLKHLRSQLLELADEITTTFIVELLTEMPVEDGHAHESFITAAERLRLPKTKQAAIQFALRASNDPNAKKYAISELNKDADGITLRLGTALPFVRKMEYGLPIKVGDLSGNQGRKRVNGDGGLVSPPGTLYGPRYSGTEGVLLWREGGQTKIAKVRIPSGTDTGFFKKAVNAAKQAAQRLTN